MNTTVLARKHRPRDFAGLVGQEHVVRALANALTQQRLHHAYLFTGTRGVGKTTVSRILAKSLNCVGVDGHGGITAAPCGVCPVCRDIDSGRFVDYVELDAASNRGVDEIAQLLEQAVYKPVVARFKVFMIDEVHMLTTHAFNAMLKTLEEPPDYLKFVLATTDPQKVPPTVLSRCLQFNLRPMGVPTVEAHLARVLADEGIAADAGSLRLIARAGRGSMRDALSLTDQAIAHGGGELQEAVVRRMLGAAESARALGLLAALKAADGAALVAQVDALRDDGQNALAAADEMLGFVQRMAVWQVAPAALSEDDADERAAAELAAHWPADELQLLYSLLVQGRSELALAPDEHAGLLMLLLRALAFRPGAEGLHGGAAAAGAASAAPRPVASPAVLGSAPMPLVSSKPPQASVPLQSTPAAVPQPVHGDAPMDRWAAWVQALSDQGLVQALVRELALQAGCLGISATPQRTEVQLQVERESLRSPASVERLRQALEQWFGHAVSLTVQAGPVSDSLALRQARLREERQAEAEALIHNDPLVRSLMQEFATARIVPGSIKPH